jgi:hypothetical protein
MTSELDNVAKIGKLERQPPSTRAAWATQALRSHELEARIAGLDAKGKVHRAASTIIRRARSEKAKK